ncbi:MAG TPA: ABC transporter permease [Steroidobacteraceae bacterium]|nr:ABC transporter permease [Steroidobacteraceae bacterium]
MTIILVVATFTLFGLLESFRHAVTTYADDFSNALVVQSRNVPLPYAHVQRVQAIEGIKSACGVMLVFGQVAAQRPAMVQAVSTAELFAVYPGIKLDDAARQRWHRERTAALVDQKVAAANGWKVGDRVMLAGSADGVVFQRPDGRNSLEMVIAGIYSTANNLAAKGIFARYDYVRDVVGSDRAGLEYITVRIRDDQDVDAMRSIIDAKFQNSAAPTKTYSFRALLRAYYGTFRDLSALSSIVLSITFVTLLLVAGSVLALAQQERIREVAVLEVLGFARLRLLGLLAMEVLALTGPAAFAGLILAGLLGNQIDVGVAVASNGVLPQHTFAAALSLLVVLAVAVFIVPAVRMIRTPLALNLRGE